MLNIYENLLRAIIIDILGEHPSDYKGISEEKANRWEEKREEQTKKDNGRCFEPRLIYYSEFYDLGIIIEKNWEQFKPIFKDKKRFQVFYKEISDHRNTVAHGRYLIGCQNLLLEGILRDTKNLRTMYHNKNTNLDDFFIRIYKISDNLGNVWTDTIKPESRPILKVGDEYELTIEAHDPKERKIHYYCVHPHTKEKSPQQTSPVIEIKIDESMIKRCLTLSIYAHTPESEYENLVFRNINISVIPQH